MNEVDSGLDPGSGLLCILRSLLWVVVIKTKVWVGGYFPFILPVWIHDPWNPDPYKMLMLLW